MRTFVTVILIVGFWASSARAVSEEGLLEAVDFIEEWTSYEYSGETLPEIKYLDHDTLQVFAHGSFAYAQAERKGRKLEKANAYYDPSRKTIYVSEAIDLETRQGRPTLIHEMVHFLQDITGYTASLDGHIACTESIAYEVQMLYEAMHDYSEDKVALSYSLSNFAAMECMGNQF